MPRIVESFIAELEHETAATKRALERVSNDKLTWKPHPKSYSLGQLALHIAEVPAAIAELIVPDTREAAKFEQASPKSAAELIPALEKSVRTAKDILSGFDDQKMMATWRFKSNGKELMALPRVALVRSIMLNHWYHHRGQLTVYLRLLGIPVPSIYGPSADENPFAGM